MLTNSINLNDIKLADLITKYENLVRIDARINAFRPDIMLFAKIGPSQIIVEYMKINDEVYKTTAIIRDNAKIIYPPRLLTDRRYVAEFDEALQVIVHTCNTDPNWSGNSQVSLEKKDGIWKVAR